MPGGCILDHAGRSKMEIRAREGFARPVVVAEPGVPVGERAGAGVCRNLIHSNYLSLTKNTDSEGRPKPSVGPR